MLSSWSETGSVTQSYPGGLDRCVDSLCCISPSGQVGEDAECSGSGFIDALSRSVLLGGTGGVEGAAGLLLSPIMSCNRCEDAMEMRFVGDSVGEPRPAVSCEDVFMLIDESWNKGDATMDPGGYLIAEED